LSLSKALQTVFPDVDWKIWKFKQVSSGFWKDIQNQRKFFLDAQKELNIQSPEDWYKVTTSQIAKLGGSGLLYLRKNGYAYLQRTSHYKASLSKALATVFPKVDWKAWRFGRSPRGFWDSTENRKRFLKHLTGENYGDWNCIHYLPTTANFAYIVRCLYK
jgi:hypothetical protein